MKAKLFLIYLVLSLAAAVIQCGGGGKQPAEKPAEKDVSQPASETGAMEVSFASQIQPLLTASCAATCHGEKKAAGLVLSEGESFAAIFDVPSKLEPSYRLVHPENPDSSYLVIKLEGTHATGKKMPIGAEFPDSSIALIRAWIASGALEN